VGWVVAALGLLSLSDLHRGLRIAGAAAAVGLLAWAADPWLGVDQGLAAIVEVVAQTVIVFATCTALMELVPAKRESANLIRWWDLGIGLVVMLFTVLLDGTRGSAPGLLILVLLLVVPALVVYVAFLVLLFRCAGSDPATPVTHPGG
jgi:hypothetical protein